MLHSPYCSLSSAAQPGWKQMMDKEVPGRGHALTSKEAHATPGSLAYEWKIQQPTRLLVGTLPSNEAYPTASQSTGPSQHALVSPRLSFLSFSWMIVPGKLPTATPDRGTALLDNPCLTG
eukprot:980400-Pelagomonas_calceolata.AAC.5